ncbi:DNA polymerase/3'-5' exonuclease PolX (plasmid) [Legionella adelaidensis]|uniref:DNA polymerase/3'-5' exonuclease PolX n=1 Tax=Legionella adelaidensis TaxID=45056 RepID=A0A0W0R1A3_9GAMM|nr:DNA polymerase/3'-5' exonuclease PolX [Legionella adelaidensis]KTC64876.1 DNA polymerase/3'-5' exonuclease PolX [Legionella adelaidensis]VEH82953.1 DNA polymerase/3'-5' exonuclease PolX [Legionella adelaidensis]
MVKSNKDIADYLYQFSDLLDAAGADRYRVRAYRRAARELLKEKEIILQNPQFDLTSIPGIGKKIASVIQHIIVNNQLPEIINSSADKKVTGKRPRKFLRLYHALPIAYHLERLLNKIPEVTKVAWCGEIRRKVEVVTSLDFLICTEDFNTIIEHLSDQNELHHIIEQADDFLHGVLWSGAILHLYNASKSFFGARLLMLTGNQKHLEELKQHAQNHSYQLNNKGLYKNEYKVAGQSEKSIYTHLKLSYIEPELREGRNEISVAIRHQLPKLITLKDIRGDLHSHTTETDGKESLETMVRGAIELGYEYVAITDHSKRLTITNGMDEKRLLNQIKQIDKLNEQLSHFRILKSIEVDILEDGSLDLTNDVLKELDIVVCSIHSRFRIPEHKQTTRILKAMDNPYFNILGHATGRLIKSRPAYEINLQKIFEAAKERGCCIELNGQPYRLDINDLYCQMAKSIGVKMAISSDAHSVRELRFMQFGIYQARRGWLEKSDVINAHGWRTLMRMIKRI